MNRRTWTVLAAVSLWLMIVAGTSTVAWLVIDRAGRQVFATDPSGLSEPPRAASSGSTTPATRVPSSSRTSSLIPSSTRPPPGTTTRSSTATPSTRPGTPLGTTSSSSSPPTPASVSDSITVGGGTVSVSCQGSTIALRYVTPRNDWSYEIERSSGSIEVKFSRSGEEAEVHATCSGGHPVFDDDSVGGESNDSPGAADSD